MPRRGLREMAVYKIDVRAKDKRWKIRAIVRAEGMRY
jgi:hypothetical protein